MCIMLRLYNTLTHKIEEFRPMHSPKVGMYSCGPTVYDYQHIGHMRRYVGDDILVRVLKENGYEVKHVMNITDVGHLVSDSDTGEDKMEKGAKKFGMSVWDIAKKFEKQFFDSMHLLNIRKPDVVIHATEAIEDQIALIEILEEKGFTYRTTDGIYFDTSKFPDYFKLSRQNPDELKAGARVEMMEGKKHPTDFALWKFSPSGEKRQMQWKSPWGTGFPGWHIECSAMSMKELGPKLDIHTGGIDHIAIHHTNEIVQSEAASGKKFVNYWVHHNFLHVDSKKMSKSIGNIYTVEDIQKQGIDPLALRYLYLQTHYRQEMNFTFDSLKAARQALDRLRREFAALGAPSDGGAWEYEKQFEDAINDDLNMPKALAILWELLKSNVSSSEKAKSIIKFDTIFGLQLQNIKVAPIEEVPQEVTKIVKEREELRKQKSYHIADQLRNKVKKMGYEIIDDDTTMISTVRKCQAEESMDTYDEIVYT